MNTNVKKKVVIVLGKLHIYASKFDWLIKIVITISIQAIWAILGQAICQFDRHYKHSMSDIYGIYRF